jgi:hypothetical protein
MDSEIEFTLIKMQSFVSPYLDVSRINPRDNRAQDIFDLISVEKGFSCIPQLIQSRLE